MSVSISAEQGFSDSVSYTENADGFVFEIDVDNNTSVGISGLTPLTKYYFWVKAYGLENITYVSDMVSATTLVGAPESVEIIFDDNDLKLIWDVVPEATSYKVYYGNSSSIDDAVEDFVYSENLSTDYISKTYSLFIHYCIMFIKLTLLFIKI